MSGGELPLPQALLLLEHDDVRGTSSLGVLGQGFGTAAAAVAELQLRGRLVPVRAGVFGLGRGEASGGALGLVEAQIGARQLSLRDHFTRLGRWGARRVRASLLDELVASGALRCERDKILGVPWRTRYPEHDPEPERRVRGRLLDHLERGDPSAPPGWEDLLLSLLRGLRLLDVALEPDQRVALGDRLEARTRVAPIGRDLRRAIRDAEAASA